MYKLVLIVLKDRNYKKYAVKKPKNIDQIIKISEWTKTVLMNKLKNYVKKITYTIFLFFYITTLKAEVVKEVQISGNQRVSDETIKVYGDIEVNKDYNEVDLNKVLNNLNSTNFFEDIKISLEQNVLKINLVEYPVISQLILIGEPSKKYSEQIKKQMGLKEKQSFIKSYLSKDIELIKNLYSTIGYNSSKIEAKVKKLNDKSVELLIEIERGNKTKISSISFTGDKKVRKDV